jgi:acyl-ACP thioesterase
MTHVGRRFTNSRKVRLGDVDPRGRLRLDAMARYLQDLSNDDTVDAGIEDAQTWVVRRVALHIERWPRLSERLDMATWCSGLGGRWAERSTTLGDAVHAAALWVFVDPKTFLPARLPPGFMDVWAEAAQGRKVRARLTHDDPPADGVTWTAWPLRATDHDVLDHMNNAAYWVPVEEQLAPGGAWAGRTITEAEIEYRVPVTPGQSVLVGAADDGRLWLRSGGNDREGGDSEGGDGDVIHASVVAR